jgi:SAM-dependent methyltransferase
VHTTTDAPFFTAIKQTQQQTWASGDYAAVAARIQPMAEHLVEAADLHAGWRVLDVAAGSGNATIAAARCDTSVLGVDYVPELLELARRRADVERLDVDLEVGDAEDLPVESASFDAVLSVVGVMFAPDQATAASELLRACRPGGTIGLASWMPSGFIGGLFGVVGRYAPPPAGVPSPMRWGDEAALRELLGDGVTDVRSVERTYTWRFTTPEALVDFFRTHYGPTLRAFGRLDDDEQQRMHDDLVALVREADVRRDGRSIAVPATYLETTCRRV